MIILFTGKRGTGKTLALTQQVVSHLDKGRTVYVNYKVNHESPLLYTLANEEKLSHFLRADVMGTLALDMAETYLAPRRNPKNELAQDLVNWSQDNILYLSAQSVMIPQITKHCDMIIECLYNSRQDLVNCTQTFDASKFFNSYDTLEILKRN